MIEDVQFKRMIEPGRKPTPAEVSEGSFVVNLADRQIYTLDHNGEVISVGGGAGGGVPVGTVLAFTKLPLPKGYLQCNGDTFDTIIYPELYKHLGVNKTPNMTDKYLKGIGEGISPLTTVPWMIPEHSHNVSSSLGSTRLQRSFNTGGGGTHNHRLWSYDSDGEGKAGGLGTWSAKSGVGTSLNAGGWPGQQYMNGDSAGHKIVEDSGNHSHSINVDFGSHGHSLSVVANGIKEALNKGNKLDVDHVTVVFGIQAVPQVDDPLKLNADKVVEDMRVIQSEFNDYKQRSSLPVGAIVLFPKLPLPSDFIPCDGTKFDKDLYHDLFLYLGTDCTPDYTKKYVKMISDELSPLQTVAWQIPEHTHNVSGTTGGQTLNKRFNSVAGGNHNHTFEISNNYGSNNHGSNKLAANSMGQGRAYPSVNFGSTMFTVNGAGNHSHAVDVNFGSHSHSFSAISSGIRESLNKGSSLDVDHIGGVYAIKCAGRIDEAQQIAAKEVIAKVNELSNRVVNPNLFDNADFTVTQRGKPATNTSYLYFADRWILRGTENTGGTSSYSIQTHSGEPYSNYLYVEHQNATAHSYFIQRVESKTPSELYGDLTFSCYLTNNQASKATLYIDWRHGDTGAVIDETRLTLPERTVENGWFQETFTCPKLPEGTSFSNLFLNVELRYVNAADNTCNGTYRFSCPKLEKGTVRTTFVPERPAVNLAKCQRYYIRIHASGEAGRTGTVGAYKFTVVFPTTMRTTPAMNLIGVTALMGCTCSAQDINPESFAHTVRPTVGDNAAFYANLALYEADAEL